MSVFSPMLASDRRVPPVAPGWVFELQHDGERVLAGIEHGHVQLRARGGVDVSVCYPEICADLAALEDRHIVDGEVCAIDAAGRSDPAQLRERARRRGPGGAPVVFFAFDLLLYRGEDIRGWPLWRRKTQLQRLLKPGHGAVRYVEHVEDGRLLFDQAVSLRLGGIVAKRRRSVYASGKRSDDWLKITPQATVQAMRAAR